MIKNILYLFSTLIIYSCSTDGFNIKGAVDLKDGNMIYLNIADTNQQPLVIDSSAIVDGSFEMSGKVKSPDINFFSVQNIPGYFPFVLESGNIRISLYKDSLMSSKALGTVSNDAFMKYKTETKVFVNSMNNIGRELQQASLLKDDLLVSDLQEQYKDVQDQIKEYEIRFIKENPDSYVSALILERIVTTKQMNNEDAKLIFDNLKPRIKKSKTGNRLEKVINAPQPPAEIGQIAPDFEGPGPSGQTVKLEESLGKITIIDFWASWCRPCRVENPNLVRIYNKLKERGLKIVGVSLDRSKDNWIKAIEDDGLQWSHVSHLQYWNEPIAKAYQVRSIPATFILDEQGKIIAKNIRGTALEQKIQELINN